jgi:hypothetical protein
MRATFFAIAIAATPLALTGACGGGSSNGTADMAAPRDMSLVINGCPSWSDPLAKAGDNIGGDTYSSYAKGFFAMWCTRCHSTTAVDRQGAPASYNWDDEASVRAHLAMIRNAVGVQNFMPFNPPNPSCDERKRLVRWIDAAAP